MTTLTAYQALKTDELVLLAAKFFGHQTAANTAYHEGDGGESTLRSSSAYAASWKFKEKTRLRTTDEAVSMMREMKNFPEWSERIKEAEINGQKELSLHWDWVMPKEFGSGQFSHRDRFVVVNTASKTAVEGHCDRGVVSRAAGIFNRRVIAQGRPAVYEVRSIPRKLYGNPPETWINLLNATGENERVAREAKIIGYAKVNYPPTIVTMTRELIKKTGSIKSIDWTALHESIISKTLEHNDIRDPEGALSEILQYSPGAVTRAEQDAACLLCKQMTEKHFSQEEPQRPPAQRM